MEGISEYNWRKRMAEEITDSRKRRKTDDSSAEEDGEWWMGEDWLGEIYELQRQEEEMHNFQMREEEIYLFAMEEECEKLFNRPPVVTLYYPPYLKEYNEVKYPLKLLSMMAIRKYNLQHQRLLYTFSSVERAFFHTDSDKFEITFKALPLSLGHPEEFFHVWAEKMLVTDVKRCSFKSFISTSSLQNLHHDTQDVSNLIGKIEEEESIHDDDDSESEEEFDNFEFPEGQPDSSYDTVYDPPAHLDYDEEVDPITKLSRAATRAFNRRTGNSYIFLGVNRAFKTPNVPGSLYDLTFTATLSGKNDAEYFHADVDYYDYDIDVGHVHLSKYKFSIPADADRHYHLDTDTDLWSDDCYTLTEAELTQYSFELDLTKFYSLEKLCGLPFRIIYDPPRRPTYNELQYPVTVYSMMAIRQYNFSKATKYTFVSLKQAYGREQGRRYIYNLTFNAALPGKDEEVFRALVSREGGRDDTMVVSVKPAVRAKTSALSY